MEDESLGRRLIILAYGAILAALAWVARTLRDGDSPGPLRLIGGIMGASIASFSFGAIVQEYFDVSNLFSSCSAPAASSAGSAGTSSPPSPNSSSASSDWVASGRTSSQLHVGAGASVVP